MFKKILSFWKKYKFIVTAAIMVILSILDETNNIFDNKSSFSQAITIVFSLFTLYVVELIIRCLYEHSRHIDFICIKYQKNREKFNVEIPTPIFIASSKDKNLNNILEQFFLCKWDEHTNNPRGNFIYVQAFCIILNTIILMTFVVNVFGYLYFFISPIKNTIDFYPLFGSILKRAGSQNESGWLLESISFIVAFYSILVWKLHERFSKKWQYCAHQFNEIIRLKEKSKAQASAPAS